MSKVHHVDLGELDPHGKEVLHDFGIAVHNALVESFGPDWATLDTPICQSLAWELDLFGVFDFMAGIDPTTKGEWTPSWRPRD
jgi:hypothetical protein